MSFQFEPWAHQRCILWPDIFDIHFFNDTKDMLAHRLFQFVRERPDFYRFSLSAASTHTVPTVMVELRHGLSWAVMGFVRGPKNNELKLPQWRVRMVKNGAV